MTHEERRNGPLKNVPLRDEGGGPLQTLERRGVFLETCESGSGAIWGGLV